MSGLAELQRAFLDAVYSDAPEEARPGVYRRTVMANLHDALAAAYPVIRRLVGDAFFREAARRYALAHPSTSGDLHRFGAALPGFLEGYPPARELAYLPDVARLEWAVARAFHAADASAFDYAALEATPAEDRGRIRLRLQPAAAIVESAHPVVSIWEANQPGRDGTPARLAVAERALVRRDGYEVRVEALAPEEHAFLQALHRQASLGEIAADARLAAALGEQVLRWTRAGVIDGFSLPPR